MKVDEIMIDKMEVDEVREMSISDFFKMCEDGGEYNIDTPDGWKNINFLVKKKNKECFKIRLDNDIELICSSTHKVLTLDGWKESRDIAPGKDSILTRSGFQNVVFKECEGVHDTFDLQVDSDESRYYSNDIVSHNCGKSLMCKAISSTWNMPLLRLDFGKLFGSLVGDSEKNAREAIKQSEAIAPAILWIDEIEKAISGNASSGRSDGGTTSRVLSTFLTWMQEKTSPVFVVATANDHQAIPPEFLRAGRFDEIFFVDLPNVNEREEIFNVLLRLRGISSKKINVSSLANKSENYSGAEIEKAIDNAMLAGFTDGSRPIITKDIEVALGEFKSLFQMRESDFEELREWADKRCRKANEDVKKKVNLGHSESVKNLDL